MIEIVTMIEKSQTELEQVRSFLLRASIKPSPVYMKNSVRLMIELNEEEWGSGRGELIRKVLHSLEAPDGMQIAIPTLRHWCLFAISRIREAIGDRYIEVSITSNLPQPAYTVRWEPATDPHELEGERRMLSVQGEQVAKEEPAGSGLVVLEGGAGGRPGG
ncbi:MAG: hypothetical protein Q8R28_23235 [Dehalococcoidia bacterium]|nr:hypothetical protein [Dehalococcoidia bacterium]